MMKYFILFVLVLFTFNIKSTKNEQEWEIIETSNLDKYSKNKLNRKVWGFAFFSDTYIFWIHPMPKKTAADEFPLTPLPEIK